MTYTVLGILADPVGLASTTVLVQGETRPELQTRAWATPSNEVRDVQADRIPVDRDHDGREVGELVYLERGPGENLWAIAHVRDNVIPAVDVAVGDEIFRLETDLFWSASRLSTEDFRDVVINGVALTRSPARLGATPVEFLPGELGSAASKRWTPDSSTRDLLKRAAEAHRARRVGDPLVVQHADYLTRGQLVTRTGDERPTGRWRRTAPYPGILHIR